MQFIRSSILGLVFFCPFCAALNLEIFSFQGIHCVLHNEGNTSHVIYKVYLYI